MGNTTSDSRRRELEKYILEVVDRRETIAGDLLYARVKAEFGDVGGREYSAVMDNLRELGMVETFDSGYDDRHRITRDGVVWLVEQS